MLNHINDKDFASKLMLIDTYQDIRVYIHTVNVDYRKNGMMCTIC